MLDEAKFVAGQLTLMKAAGAGSLDGEGLRVNKAKAGCRVVAITREEPVLTQNAARLRPNESETNLRCKVGVDMHFHSSRP